MEEDENFRSRTLSRCQDSEVKSPSARRKDYYAKRQKTMKSRGSLGSFAFSPNNGFVHTSDYRKLSTKTNSLVGALSPRSVNSDFMRKNSGSPSKSLPYDSALPRSGTDLLSGESGLMSVPEHSTRDLFQNEANNQ